MSSSSFIEVETIGLSKAFTISRAILLSGILIPTVFFLLLKILGILPVAFSITVYDPELIHEKYNTLVDMVIDGGYGENVASTVVDCTDDLEYTIIREGKGDIDQIY